MKQTAVEWIEKQLIEGAMRPVEIIAIAKAMEKEQIEQAYNEGLYQDINSDILLPFEQYYNETYGKN